MRLQAALSFVSFELRLRHQHILVRSWAHSAFTASSSGGAGGALLEMSVALQPRLGRQPAEK
jgi:hypothetical protein